MSIAWFVTFRHPSAHPGDEDRRAIAEALAALDGVREALLFTPSATHDPYLDDGPPPPLVIQTTFETIEALEHASCARLPALSDFAGRTSAAVSEQAMLVRRFPVPDAAAISARPCTYLVSYEGEAEDINLWLHYYIAHHPPIMARFPGIRRIEIYSRIDWCSTTGWRRENAMQRNKVVFDSPDALTAALNSPVRHEMRADFKQFPQFTGANTHYPMWTDRVV
jgi:uncharacterized protein (TIGR02118 family)